MDGQYVKGAKNFVLLSAGSGRILSAVATGLPGASSTASEVCTDFMKLPARDVPVLAPQSLIFDIIRIMSHAEKGEFSPP